MTTAQQSWPDLILVLPVGRLGASGIVTTTMSLDAAAAEYAAAMSRSGANLTIRLEA